MNAKLFALSAVAVILCSSCIGGFVTEEREEPDEFPPIIIAVMIAAAAGGAAGWLLNDYFDSPDADVQPHLRLAAANNLANMMSVASTFTSNSNANYSQLWNLTKEHWIRQAELEAYSEWSHGGEYDGNSILSGARVYENNSAMTANAVAQIDSFFDEVSEKITDWRTKGTYSEKMKVSMVFDNTEIASSGCDWNADVVSVADCTGTTSKIYVGTIDEEYIVTTEDYSPAYVYNLGNRTTISSEDGLTYTLDAGKTYLSSLKSDIGDKAFQAGIYSVTNSVIGGDTLSSVMGEHYVPLKAGIAFSTDGQQRYAIMGEDSMFLAGNPCDKVSFAVIPEDIPSGEKAPEPVDLTQILVAYQKLLDRIYWTSVIANNAASSVWSIYNSADEKNYGVTTLMASNVYDTVVLSQEMNQAMALSAMQQLATYYDANEADLSNLVIGLYGEGMDAPFVRGNILDEYNVLYHDVIFTPFFQSNSVRLDRGTDYTVDQNVLVAVWTEGEELTEWYSNSMNSDDYETVFVEKGCTFEITQLGICDSSGMHNVSSVDFEVSKVNYVQPGKVNPTPDPDPEEGTKNILKIICIIGGAILILLGVFARRIEPVIIGVALMVFGLLFADRGFNWISKVT